MKPLRFRQVHLDFHTSGAIPGIGASFDKLRFQEALKRGRVNSITLFSKCHHGYSYHPTRVGARHPHLQTDLLARQIEACREIDVRCPIYLSAGLDEYAAHQHPEWIVKRRDGTTAVPFKSSWRMLRFNSPYLDYLCAQIEEVVQRWPDNDGIFLDIISAQLDYSDDALEEMRAAGLNSEDEADARQYAESVLYRYFERTTAAAKSVRADTPVLHNSGDVSLGNHRAQDFNTHFELESLPTGGWGYDHFPLLARHVITRPKDFLGMTGKFHNTWGEFGGFKRANALRYECAAMLAYGAKCSIGDQLHPSGEMNPDTYALIGEAYAEVEAKEPWCGAVRPVAKIAIVSSRQNQARWSADHTSGLAADEGAGRMLLELHQPFVVLDEHASWDGYEVVVLPEGFVMSAAKREQAQAFLARGGRILAAGSALLNEARDAFALPPVAGVSLRGRSPYDPDYLLATALTPRVPVKSPIVIHGGAYEVELGEQASAPAAGAVSAVAILAARRVPYFNRTWERFCSHQHTPDAPAQAAQPLSPAAVASEQIAYFAHDLFTAYRRQGQPLYRDFFEAALRHLFGGTLPVETAALPTSGRVNVLEQAAERRYVAHLLYAPTNVRGTFNGKPIEIIEDLVPLRGVELTLRLPRLPKTVRLVPSRTSLEFAAQAAKTPAAGNSGRAGGGEAGTGDGAGGECTVRFTVPEFTAHQMVELAY
ncbi:alpha-amylase [Cephaloticoccus primus]|uniref:Alpha-amylase n=1 Tax=Cephaloticoccus primus TaxID=1548207 RepID=A0A139SUD2_9BACT|nr:alpha-amylase family protein [Cephaloticoccus primus]KXU38218.1 alpha-amylase [Cephaloticoccus primus]